MAQPAPDAFLSYTRFDDQNDGGAISEFRLRLSNAVRAVTGQPFEIFQDIDGIGLGEKWFGKLDQILDQARFFIPIITPSYFSSAACRDEIEKFLRAEAARGRSDLVLPIYYIECDLLEDAVLRRVDPLASAIHERQRQDWRDLRFEPFTSPRVRRALESVAREIVRARRGATPKVPARIGEGPRRKVEERASDRTTEQLRLVGWGRAHGREHIVVVDDEPEICEGVSDYLGHAGYKMSTAQNGAELRNILETGPVDLVLLDINMPGEDGLSVARYLRANTKIGIIMFTAAGGVVDRIVGLEMGADDYIAKPVDMRELLARVRAVLRRKAAELVEDGEAAAPSAERIRFGACQLDPVARKFYDAAGQEVPITSMEYDLLKAFAEHPNQVLSRDQLLDFAHNVDWEPFDRTIDIRVARLRRKIETDPSKPKVIKTVRGAGYIFVPAGASR